MKKLKIYLDTSVISHLLAEDTKEKMNDTILLWNKLKSDKYEVFISTVVLDELEKCSEPKRTLLIESLENINFDIIEGTDEIDILAKEYVVSKVLSENNFADCLHISSAVVNECDLIISWNFKHLVNFNTIKNVKIVNSVNNYKEINIITPAIFIGDEKNE